MTNYNELAQRALMLATMPPDLYRHVEDQRAQPDISLHDEIAIARALIADYIENLRGVVSQEDTTAIAKWQNTVGRLVEAQHQMESHRLTHADVMKLRANAFSILPQYAPDADTARKMYLELFGVQP